MFYCSPCIDIPIIIIILPKQLQPGLFIYCGACHCLYAQFDPSAQVPTIAQSLEPEHIGQFNKRVAVIQQPAVLVAITTAIAITAILAYTAIPALWHNAKHLLLPLNANTIHKVKHTHPCPIHYSHMHCRCLYCVGRI